MCTKLLCAPDVLRTPLVGFWFDLIHFDLFLSLMECLVSGLMWLRTGSIHNNSCLVQKACGLDWLWVEILIENVCFNDPSKKIEPFRPTSSHNPLPLHPLVTHALSTRDQHRSVPPLPACGDEGPPSAYPPTLIPRLPPVVRPPLAYPPMPACSLVGITRESSVVIEQVKVSGVPSDVNPPPCCATTACSTRAWHLAVLISMVPTRNLYTLSVGWVRTRAWEAGRSTSRRCQAGSCSHPTLPTTSGPCSAAWTSCTTDPQAPHAWRVPGHHARLPLRPGA
jgi:hypothetical protein